MSDIQINLFNTLFKPTGFDRLAITRRRPSYTARAILRFTLVPVVTLLTSVVLSASVNCTNSSGDPQNIQSAVNSGGTVTVTGTCAMGSSMVSINNPVTITGNATLMSSQSQVFQINSNGVTIDSMVINGGYVAFGGANNYSNFTFTNNTIENLTSAGVNGGPAALIGPGLISSTISHNKFLNLWGNGGGYPNSSAPPPNSGAPNSQVESWGSAGLVLSGLQQTVISYNTFDQIGNDAIHIDWEAFTGNIAAIPNTTGNVIAYNIFTHIRRIPMEIQSQPAGQCPGGCNYSITNTIGLQIKGNYVHDFTPYSFYDTWGASLVPDGAVGSQYLNNTFIANPGSGDANGYGGYAACMESSGRNNLSQGNICASVAGGSSGFDPGVAQGDGSNNNFTSTYQNNIFCGSTATTQLGQESPTNPPTNSVMVDQFNYKNANGCPAGAALTTSSVNASFVGSPSVSGSNETWKVAVISNLSIRYVQFFVDSAATPAFTQEISDVNTNFANDQKWLYHLTLSGTGTHLITAVVTDVSGAPMTISTGSSIVTGTPNAVLTPSSLAFGSQAISAASAAQTATLSNMGTASLFISSIALAGTGSGNFGTTSTCGSMLAAGSSCTVSIRFTPASAGPITASLVVTDNSATPTQTVTLNGTGQGSSSNPLLPTNLPTGMMLWLANNAGLVKSGNGVTSWQDQSGNSLSAVAPTTANQPTVVGGNNGQNAVHFDGASSLLTVPSLPITGLSGMTVFMVSANNQDQPGAAYGTYSFLNWPETAYWGTTFFGTYQTSSHFRFGTTQAGNENTYGMPFTRTNSFGLSEFMHSTTTDIVWFNGQSVASFTGKLAPIAGSGNTLVIGAGNANTFYPGDVSEVIIYNRSLSNAERQTVEQYLMSKYHL